MSKTFYFYKNNVKIESFKNDENLIVDDISFSEQIKLHYFDNYIIIIPSDDCEFVTQLETIKKCVLNSADDIVVLKYLFEKYGLMFYSDEYVELVEYLDEEKDSDDYDQIIRKHIVETMVHYGIVTDISVFGEKFFNPYIIHDANVLRYKRMRRDLLWCKIKLFLKKIFRFFFNG